MQDDQEGVSTKVCFHMQEGCSVFPCATLDSEVACIQCALGLTQLHSLCWQGICVDAGIASNAYAVFWVALHFSCLQGIVGVRFKRLIMDDTGIMPKSRAPRPPQEAEYKRVVFCSGKVGQWVGRVRVYLGGGQAGDCS